MWLKRTLAILSPFLLCGALGAAEQLFELTDGRTVRGEKAGEEDAVVIVTVQAGNATAKVRLPKDEIAAVHAVVAEQKEVPAAKPAESKPTVEAKATEGELVVKPRAKPTDAEEFARVRELLAAAAGESREPPPRTAVEYQSTMPGSDVYFYGDTGYYPWYPYFYGSNGWGSSFLGFHGGGGHGGGGHGGGGHGGGGGHSGGHGGPK
jgi:uncharacterized membrane protein YgcG